MINFIPIELLSNYDDQANYLDNHLQNDSKDVLSDEIQNHISHTAIEQLLELLSNYDDQANYWNNHLQNDSKDVLSDELQDHIPYIEMHYLKFLKSNSVDLMNLTLDLRNEGLLLGLYQKVSSEVLARLLRLITFQHL